MLMFEDYFSNVYGLGMFAFKGKFFYVWGLGILTIVV